MRGTIVTMRFRLQQGRSKEDWLRANERVDAWIRRQPGFRSRSLSETDGGEWIIIAHWTSVDAANKADKDFARKMGGLIFPLVDMDSFTISHSTVHAMLKGEERPDTDITAVRSGHLYRIDSFVVPEGARGEFLERIRQTHDLLETRQGFVQDAVLEQVAGDGECNFVTLVEWDSKISLENAKAAVAEMHAQMQFNSEEMFERLGIAADRASYRQIDGRNGKAAGGAVSNSCGKACVSFLMAASVM